MQLEIKLTPEVLRSCKTVCTASRAWYVSELMNLMTKQRRPTLRF